MSEDRKRAIVTRIGKINEHDELSGWTFNIQGDVVRLSVNGFCGWTWDELRDLASAHEFGEEGEWT